MSKKPLDSFFILFSSGILLHRSTLIGILCGVWVYLGADMEESAFNRMLTPDLYLFMASFLIFYRLLFKAPTKPDGDIDFQAMLICFLGDFAWAVAAMFCTVPFLMLFSYTEGTADYSEHARAVLDPKSLIKKLPRP